MDEHPENAIQIRRYILGIISEEEPTPEVAEQLKGVHEFLGNVQLDEGQVAYAMFMAEEPD